MVLLIQVRKAFKKDNFHSYQTIPSMKIKKNESIKFTSSCAEKIARRKFKHLPCSKEAHF